MNDKDLSPSARKIADFLDQQHIPCKVVELADSTRTAPEAAAAVGCSVAQIVKSLVFRARNSGNAILILVSGSNRVDVDRIAKLMNEPIGRADPDFVREHTGFVIGGVPPFGFPKPLTTLIDQDLLQYDLVWAAAGTPHAVFCIHPEDLVRISGGQLAQVC